MRFAFVCFGLAVLSFFHSSIAQPGLNFNQFSTNLRTNVAPSVVNFNKQYQMYFQDPGGQELYGSYANQDDPTLWSNPLQLNLVSNRGPNVISQLQYNADNNTLNLFFREGSDGRGVQYYTKSVNGPWTASSIPSAFITIYNQPEAAVAPDTAQANPGRIVVVGDADADLDAPGGRKITYAVIQKGKLLGHSVIEKGDIRQNGPPCIVWFKESWYVYYRSRDVDNIQVIWSADGSDWKGPKTLVYTTSSGPAAVVYNYGARKPFGKDYVYLFFRASSGSDEIYYVYSEDGTTFNSAPSGVATGLHIEGEPSATFRLGATGDNTEFMIAGRNSKGEIMVVTATPA